MIITIVNKTEAQKRYVSNLITVPASDSVTIARDFNALLASDENLIADLFSRDIAFTLGSSDYEYEAERAVDWIKTLSAFATDPLATSLLYYSAMVNITQSESTSSGTAVWTLLNPGASPLNLMIQRIFLTMSFDASTPLTGINLQRYQLCRFTGTTPSGGNAGTVVKANTLSPASAALVRYVDTGLTMTGVSYESAFCGVSCPEVLGAVSNYTRDRMCFKLAPGEGLAIRISDVDAAVGQSLVGEIVWSLR